MNVSLREITPENFRKCVNLKVAEGQQTFVAPNVMSIAQSKIYPTMNIRAVYADEEMVGFTMFGLDTDDNRYYLVRLMIDERFQGKGYGKAVLSKIIEAMKQIEGCREIYLSFVPGNDGAEALYRNAGFVQTGENNEYGEMIMRLTINNNANTKSSI
jgi:diamine N-acetyltransferase